MEERTGMEADGRVTVEAVRGSGGRRDLGLDRFFKALPLVGASPEAPEEPLLPTMGIFCLMPPVFPSSDHLYI